MAQYGLFVLKVPLNNIQPNPTVMMVWVYVSDHCRYQLLGYPRKMAEKW